MTRLRHGRVELALHTLRSGDGPPLLLLHALRGSSDDWAATSPAWPGPVHALDFTGHGRSTALRGGAYYCELLAADVDAALAHLDDAEVALAGCGLGAYVALLVAGGRPERVPAALLLPGTGLAGGGDAPDFDAPRPVALSHPLDFFERDVRPAEYAGDFAASARRLLLLEDGAERPPWWRAAARSPSAELLRADPGVAFARLAR